MLLISKSKNNVLIIVVLLVMLSNFYDLKFYEVDKIDSASSINLLLDFKEVFIEDFNLRNNIAQTRSFIIATHKLLFMKLGLMAVQIHENKIAILLLPVFHQKWLTVFI